MNWLSSSFRNDATCPCCRSSLEGYAPSADHHATKCIRCGETLVVISSPKRSSLVAINHCPPELKSFLKWTQENLDELEFVGLIVQLEEVFGLETAGE